MSVATRNPFAILDAEDSSRPSTPAPKPLEQSPPPPASRPAQRGRGGPASRAGKYYQRGGKGGPRDPQSTNPGEESTPGALDGAKKKFDGEARGRGRGKGRGAGSGGGGARNTAGGRGRPFDRHSQTGKTDSDKKVHQSWGGDDGPAELKTEQAATNDATEEKAAVNDWGTNDDTPADDPWGAPSADAAPADDPWATSAVPVVEGDKPSEREARPRREREPEEEDNTLTLDQYLAQKKDQDASVVPKLEGRKANEGADDSLWKDVVQLKKGDDEQAYFAGKGKAPPKPRAKKEEKVFLEIDAHFERPSRGGRGARGGDRGDRGGRGGRGGRAPYRSGRPNGAAQVVNVDDTTAFPSLS